MKKSFLTLIALTMIILLDSCGGGTEQKEAERTDTASYAPEQPAVAYDPAKVDPNAPVMEINLEALGNSMDVMSFSMSEIRVKSGTTVKLHLINRASDAAMKHNFFIVKDGTAESVAMASNTAGADKNFIPDDKTNVLYTSRVLEPGESEDLIFAAPPSGTYQFVCTYPGHWQKMHGRFVVD